jgi:hypothetical protein
MKAKIALLIMLAGIVVLLSGNLAYAAPSNLQTSITINVTMIIPSNVSLNLDEGWISQNLKSPEAEAFSDLKKNGVLVEKVKRGDSTVWLFTKIE